MREKIGFCGIVLLILLLSPATLKAAQQPNAPQRPLDLILITLDTTRSDHLGCYGDPRARTPFLDALASRAVLYRHAITTAPLTLPAHASLLTGLEPIAHGVRANGTTTLPAALPTLATILQGRGYDTAAFVSSRVLDRRFGLAHGFNHYDDSMLAEQIGEYGYPERDAAAVTNAALAWIGARKSARPLFLWIHYYDPHAPYLPPQQLLRGQDAYSAEISYVDQQIGRLISAIAADRNIIAVAGDHGEALGEHGEKTHGILLQRSTLEVPLLIAIPGSAPERIEQSVGTVRLASTLLKALGFVPPVSMAPALPLRTLGIGAPVPIYSETELPAVAYGWSDLRAVTDDTLRFVAAPEPELYDESADPREERNLVNERRREAVRLQKLLNEIERIRGRASQAPPITDPALSSALQSLGYLSTTGRKKSGLDPKRGLPLLAEYDEARRLLADGQAVAAREKLQSLVERNSGNVPFLTELAHARAASGDLKGAVEASRAATELNPQLDFLHLNLADSYRISGDLPRAEQEYRLALRLNPRLAAASLRLAELEVRRGRRSAARTLLQQALAKGVVSASVLTTLARLEMEDGVVSAATTHATAATDLAPGWAAGWIVRGDLAKKKGDLTTASNSYSRAVRADPDSAAALLRLAQLLAAEHHLVDARALLQRCISVSPASPEGRQAAELLSSLK